MSGERDGGAVAQAWIALLAEDPEAASALAVARRTLAAGRGLGGLRRLRLLELAGRLPERARIETLLHESTQFYNPHKERCQVRLAAEEPVPLAAGERLVLVVERGGLRRGAAERWWLQQTGERIEVHEGIVWALRFADGADAERGAAELAELKDAAHGLFCNPHAQEYRLSGAEPPLPWLPRGRESTTRRRS